MKDALLSLWLISTLEGRGAIPGSVGQEGECDGRAELRAAERELISLPVGMPAYDAAKTVDSTGSALSAGA